jgi:hypothetical protein
MLLALKGTFGTVKIQRENVVLTDGPSDLFVNKILNNASAKSFKYWPIITEFRKEFSPVLL